MDFRKEYRSRMSRLGAFRTLEEFEIQKTVRNRGILLA